MAQFLLRAPEMSLLNCGTAGKGGKKMEKVISLLQPQYFEDGCPLQFGVNSGEITSGVIWKPDFGKFSNPFALECLTGAEKMSSTSDSFDG